MGATKHCCYGICRSDSRYSDRDHMKDVFFIGFTKSKKDREKCERWVRACGRECFKVDNVNKDTYICSLHFVGGKGPTNDHPDPIHATATPQQIDKFSKKRKAPTPRSAESVNRPKKRLKFDIIQAAETLLQMSTLPATTEDEVQNVPIPHIVAPEPAPVPETAPRQGTRPESESEPSRESNVTKDSKHDRAYVNIKIENVLLKNDLDKLKSKFLAMTTIDKYFSFEDVKLDDTKCKFYTGLTWPQFMCLWDFLGPAKNKLAYFNQPLQTAEKSPCKRPGVKRKIDPMNELFLTLVRLRTGLLNTDLQYRFGIAESTVSKIVSTWIQFMYKSFSRVRKNMFASRHQVAKHLPPSFRKFKGVRVVIDCTEFFVEQANNFERQGNMYSSYKCHATYKVLIGIAPSGAITYVSDAFEGSISDVQIVKDSGFLDALERGDLVIADRGFTIREILSEKGVDLNIPPFLYGRDRLTPEEEILTKQIARVRIHVERAIERLKKFRLLKKIIPLSLQPVFSQMVFVAACLVNFQDPIVP